MAIIKKKIRIFGAKFCSYFLRKKNYHRERYHYNSTLSSRKNNYTKF